MRILSFKTGHDPAACLLEDGKIIAAVEEERFNRVKHAADFFPEKSIRYCLSTRNLTLDEVDYIVFARAKNFSTFLKVGWYFLMRPPRNFTELRYMFALVKVQVQGLFSALRGLASYKRIFEVMGVRARKVYSFDHHLCHAASAYYGSGFDEAAILCMDGKGEATSISMWYGKGGGLKLLKRYGIFNSLGYLYGSITDFLGFRINDGEYKVMGLAPYGKAVYEMDDVISVGDRGVRINTRYSLYPFSIRSLEARFPNINREYQEDTPPQPNTDIAATLQDRLEKATLYYVRELLLTAKSYKLKAESLCLAGGVALNVKMNKAIWESGLVKNMWIQPAAGDMGNVFGAAWLLYYQKTGRHPEPLRHLYLGPEYSQAEIEKSLARSGLNYKKSDDIADEVVNLLSQKKIVAWFQGRMEFGPRALGSRSVLADPRTAQMKDIINAKVKFREPFRPFCPSFLEGHGEEFLEHYMPSPYMVMSFSVKPEWREKITAVCHVDNTVRPQEVFHATNPLYAKMIEYFFQKTGVPVVLNTSLNVKGEPIVNTPEEAVLFFKKTDVDYLAIGPYLAKK
ncbi:MAG: carbamoyltransferase [Candidatus Sungiibacteriota bacterium]|uniref:Carbamoyltransferase n=1 Tax=Candidatus Sungiibacteriota bacterium TaxID=2750080 RepID=A0A7T5RJT2_9BACT|nr:MAG: carbamoyltransferase [Candidatus Sungbacteria bacterium]